MVPVWSPRLIVPLRFQLSLPLHKAIIMGEEKFWAPHWVGGNPYQFNGVMKYYSSEFLTKLLNRTFVIFLPWVDPTWLVVITSSSENVTNWKRPDMKRKFSQHNIIELLRHTSDIISQGIGPSPRENEITKAWMEKSSSDLRNPSKQYGTNHA